MGKRPIGNILTSLFVDRPISMLKTCREWCPDCLQEWHNSDREIYEPLLWSLSLVAICPHHDPEQFAKAVVRQGLPLDKNKAQVTLRIDSDVLDWFKSQGRGYQTQINSLLRAYKEAHH